MAKRKPKVVRATDVGLLVSKGAGGFHVHQLYDVRYSDGTSETIRGNTVFAWPGLRDLNKWMVPKEEQELQKKLYRPDLSCILQMVHVAWERLSSACYEADTFKDKPHGRSTKSNRRKGTRR